MARTSAPVPGPLPGDGAVGSRQSAVGRRGTLPAPGRPDLAIAAVVMALAGIGLVIVYSASFVIGLNDYGNANYFIVRQVMGTVAGLVAMAVLARTDYHRLKAWSPLILLVALVGLAVVLLPGVGHNSNGAARWIRVGPLPPFQPSEFAKLAMVIYIAAWLSAKGSIVKQFSLGVIPFVMMVGLVGGLIMLEPDMGTFLVIVLTTGTMFFVAGASISHIITLVLAGLAGGTVLIAVEGYRAERLLSFLQAEKDPAGKGYQILQLLIALGSGGVRGLGLGESRQKFLYVPGAHTDGIFAIVGEELGFVGGMLVLGLFVVLVVRGLRAATRARDDFGYLLAVGVTCWISYQAVINIAGITRSLPLTGIPLPFLSYGVSSLVTTLAAVGVLLSVSRHATTGEPREGGMRRRNHEHEHERGQAVQADMEAAPPRRARGTPPQPAPAPARAFSSPRAATTHHERRGPS